MSLIHCPECDREISDKVKACPHCGYPFEEQESESKEPQQVEVTSVNLKPRNPNIIKRIVIALVAIGIVAVFIMGYTATEKQAALKEYKTNVDKLITKMNESAFIAEKMCDLTREVWHNAIYEERSDNTDAFTMTFNSIGGRDFVKDFNDALVSLYTATSTKEHLKEIQNSQDLVQKTIKLLQNPPEEYRKSYDVLMEVYSSYQSLTDLAINPTGSYQIFTEASTKKVQDYKDNLNKLMAILPDKKAN